MELIITEEDHRFIDSIVDRFDPVKTLAKPTGATDEDWATYLGPLRGGLRQHVYETLAVRALRAAGFKVTVDEFQSTGGPNLRKDGESRGSEEWDRAYERVTSSWDSFKEEDAFLAPIEEDVDQAREVILSEAV